MHGCDCGNIVLVVDETSKDDKRKIRRVASNDSLEKLPVLLEGQRRRSNRSGTLGPRRVKRLFAPDVDIYSVGPASVGVHDGSNAYVSEVENDCFDLVCKTCMERFRIAVDNGRGSLQQQRPVASLDVDASLLTRLPICLRRFMNFDTLFLSRIKVGDQMDEEAGQSDGQDSMSGIVGSYQESAVMGFGSGDSHM